MSRGAWAGCPCGFFRKGGAAEKAENVVLNPLPPIPLPLFFDDCGSDFRLLPLNSIELPAGEATTPGIRFVLSLRGSTSPQAERPWRPVPLSRQSLKPPLRRFGFRFGGRSDSPQGRWAPKRARRTVPLQPSRGERRRGGIHRVSLNNLAQHRCIRFNEFHIRETGTR